MRTKILLLTLFFVSFASADKKFVPKNRGFQPKKLAKKVQKFQGKDVQKLRIKQKVFGKNYQQKAQNFLKQKLPRGFSNFKNDTPFKTLKTDSFASGGHVRFCQMYDGKPVYNSEMVVSINIRDEVTMFFSNYKSSLNLKVAKAQITAKEALEHAYGYLKITKEDHLEFIAPPKTKLMVVENNDNDQLAYKVNIAISAKDLLGDFELLVSAVDGQVLTARNMIKNHSEDGQAMVFNPDPLSSARKSYGQEGFVDNDDNDSEDLNIARVLVTLRGVTFENGNYHLKNKYVELRDLELPQSVFPALPTPNFMFTRSQQEFESVMVFHFLNESRRYLESLGFDIQPQAYQGGLRVDPHGANGSDNSHFAPSLDILAFGEGGVDDAEDVDVILHEFGHAIQDFIVPGFRGEEGLGEGFGDYWAQSYSRSVAKWRKGDAAYDFIFSWDGHNEYWEGRTTNLKAHYPEDLKGNVHFDGQLWSTPLMQLHDRLGKEVTDKLVIKSHYFIAAGATQRENAEALLQADEDLFNNAHRQDIIDIFGAYGQLSHLLKKENESSKK